jgi:eukaryotic-like serine/threonine-protein kinase
MTEAGGTAAGGPTRATATTGGTELVDVLRASLQDRYLVEGEIGRGGMAAVFRAEDLKHGRTVAIKVMMPDVSATIGAERFLREIRIAARLSHPHILTVHDSGEAAGLLYYVMPFVEGESLRDKLERETQLGIDEAVQITLEVSDALAYAHTQGVVHRDIKPENVLLFGGHAVVADFGIARAMSEAATDKLTATGASIGTAAYMSPEQFTGSEVDGRADIYSLACMLYEMLVGQVPFTGPNAIVIMARATVEMAPPIRVVRPNVAPDLEDVVLQGLEKVPADRFQTMQHFREALLGEGQGAQIRRTTRMTRMSRYTNARASMYAFEIPLPWYRRRGPLAAAAGVVLALVGAGVAAMKYGSPSFGNGSAVTQAGTVTSALLPKRVAVLYFDDLSTRDSLAPLAAGLTENLIEQLEQVRALDVVSSNGVRPYRGTTVGTDSIAIALKAGIIVKGSVEPVGDSLHVRVRVIDGATADEKEKADFKRPKGDVLGIRDSVATRVADLLRKVVGDDVRLRALRESAHNADAWLLVRQAERAAREAQLAADSGSSASAIARLRRADSLLAGAERLDAKWVEPIVLRAYGSYQITRLVPTTAAGRAAMDSALSHAGRAAALAPRSPEVLELLGTLHYGQVYFQYVEAPAEVARLLALAEQELVAATTAEPYRATAWQVLADLRTHKADVPGALNAARKAYEEDAYLAAAPQILWQLFAGSYETEDFQSAEGWCKEASSRFPSNPRLSQRCQLFMLTTDYRTADPTIVDEAWRVVGRWKGMVSPQAWASQERAANGLAAIVIARAQMRDSALHVIERIRAGGAADPSRSLDQIEARVRVLLGEKDKAIDLLTQYLAVNPEVRSGWARRTSWWFDEMKGDPRFQALIRTGG